MSRNYSHKRSQSQDDSALYMRDYNTSIKTKKLLVRLSLVMLLILFSASLLLSDYIGEELAIIMMVAPVVLAIIWALVAWFYKGEPPPNFGPPVDIGAEFGKEYFQSPESIETEEALSRISRMPKGKSVKDTVVKIID